VKNPKHPYTVGLMGAIPTIGGNAETLTQIDGSMPRLTEIPRGCAFNPRCPKAFDRCQQDRPEPIPVDRARVACWLYEQSMPARG
jgi:peptide/nickel transport system ATP-binding protein